MKQIKYSSKKELILKIKDKKELLGLTDSVVEEILKRYIKKYKLSLKNLPYPQSKTVIKEVRAELRTITGQFQKSLKDKSKLSDSGSYTKLLETHSSTAERLEFYPILKEKLNKIGVRSILDLGCGLNPIALASPQIKYFASDIQEDELTLIDKFFKKHNIKGKVFVYDLRKISNDLPEADICILFKILDLLDNKKKRGKLTEKILKKVPCKKILVSFSTRKLSGKPMNYPKRFWFENVLEKLKFDYKKFESKNEVFYLIEKINHHQ